MGEIDEYDYKNDTLGVHYTVKCGATPSTKADTTLVKDTIKLKTTNYGKSHFTNRIARFNSVKDCTDNKAKVETCLGDKIKPSGAEDAKTMAKLFEGCFEGIENVDISL